MARITVVSDTHLSPTTPEALASWDAVVAYTGEVAHDLVVHAGDLTLDGANDPTELQAARRQLDRVAVPWLAVPGNHDTGDTPPTGGGRDVAIDARRRSHWVRAIGPDWWSAPVGDWVVVAVDSQLLGSGLAEEDEQWEWLGSTLARLDRGRPVLLVTHKPMAVTPADDGAASGRRFIDPAAGRRLDELTADRNVRAVVSGHVHQQRVVDRRGVTQVWAPTTWAVLPDSRQPVYGAKRCGLLSMVLGPGGSLDVEVVELEGIAQRTLGRDLPDPYHR